jgi:hypothetical protein
MAEGGQPVLSVVYVVLGFPSPVATSPIKR